MTDKTTLNLDRIEYQNKDRYYGELSEGCRHGEGTYTFSNGDHYEGSWVYNIPSGYGTYRFAKGGIYVG